LEEKALCSYFPKSNPKVFEIKTLHLQHTFLAGFLLLLIVLIKIIMTKKIIPAVIVLSVAAFFMASAFSVTNVAREELKPDENQSLVCKELTALISIYNYKKVPINDSLSSVIFDRYIESLDGNRQYFLRSDIKEFEKYRHSIDEYLVTGDLTVPFSIFNTLQKRYEERIQYVIGHSNVKPDYTLNETFQFNREKEEWIGSVEEMNKYWDKRVKYDLLNLKLASADEEKNSETLKKRYENLLTQSQKVNSYDAFQAFMSAFTESVDPHTNYFNPSNAANFNVDMSRALEGIGATLRMDNEFVTVNSIVPGGPADKSGQIAVDDKFIAVAQGDGEFTDIIGWRLDNAIQLIRGAKGTVVRLKIIPKGQDISAAPKIVELVREKIILQDQSAKKEVKTVKQGNKTYKIGVIDIPAFYIDAKALQSGDPNYKSTSRDVRLILDTLKQEKVDAVIIDLRSNGGGSLKEAIDLTGLFIQTGPVVQVRDTRNRIDPGEDADPYIGWDGPLAVMVDRFSASASEIFSGAIQDYGRGIVIGNQTYGKGTVQSAIDLDQVINGSDEKRAIGKENTFGQINLTVAKFYRINGSSTQHKGVMPDVQFPMIYPADKFGESSEPSALPWDEIKPSQYKALKDLTPVKKQLISQHDKRMQDSKEYQYLLTDINEFKKRDTEKTVTLNEVQLKKEREAKELKDLERENQRRMARGLTPLKKGETKPKGEKPYDFILDESTLIVADYLKTK
jgi:carboxyl-terminal processing protease